MNFEVGTNMPRPAYRDTCQLRTTHIMQKHIGFSVSQLKVRVPTQNRHDTDTRRKIRTERYLLNSRNIPEL